MISSSGMLNMLMLLSMAFMTQAKTPSSSRSIVEDNAGAWINDPVPLCYSPEERDALLASWDQTRVDRKHVIAKVERGYSPPFFSFPFCF
jgi:hypothetical protein